MRQINREFILKEKDMKNNKKLRNSVMTAHGCYNNLNNFKYYLASYWHKNYRGFIVTKKQIKQAKEIYKKQQKETLKKYKNVLLFEGAGMEDASSVENTDINNPRIRTCLINNKGFKIYLELSYSHYEKKPGSILVDHCINETEREQTQDCNKTNYKKLEGRKTIKYNKKSILEFVNNNLDCSFESIHIENYDIGGVVFKKAICESPNQ